MCITYPSRLRGFGLALGLLSALQAGPAGAQGGPPSTWIAFDASPAGTPANIVLDAAASSPSSTRFDVFIHGLWRTERTGPGGQVYQQISIPGLPSDYTVGAPELPILRFDLGIVTGAPQATLAEFQVFSEQVIPNILPWPHPIPEIPDTSGTPEQFALDPAFYTSAAGYPQGPGMAAGAATLFAGTLRAAPGEVYPVHWDPSGNLRVATHASYLYQHAGTPTQAEMPTNMSKTSSVTRLLNRPIVSPWTWVDPVHHAGYFLFIHSAVVSAEIDMLIWQKKLRGFGVTVIHTEDLGGYGDFFVRAAIENWYASTPANGDHYCLLVGDVNIIPLWRTVTNYPPPVAGPILTDDIYGDADADGVDDLNEEVHIGRLSYNGGLDLMYQVGRILAYEDQPSPQQPFDRANLIAWRSDPSIYGSDTRFENTQDQVAAASYSQPVSFTKFYGSNLALHNSWISSLAVPAGILAYVGHGGEYEWWSWNWFKESYTWADVAQLNNGPITPVVWSLTCMSGAIQNSDCMLEYWMSHGDDGAAAAYGATREAYIRGIQVQAPELFRAVFDLGITVHSQAIEFAEAECTKVDPIYNELEFLLLGDPEMHIRRKLVSPSAPWVLTMPLTIPAACPSCTEQPVDIQVLQGPGGLPAVGVQVSLYKQPGPIGAAGTGATPVLPGAGPDEFQGNRYTDGEGDAHFIVPPLTEGTLYVTVTNDEGDVLTQTISVTGTTSVGAHGEAGLRLTAAPSVSHGPVELSFGRALEHETRIALYDVTGRQVRMLRAPAGALETRWDGANEAGVRVAAGLYLASMEGVSRNTARILIVR